MLPVWANVFWLVVCVSNLRDGNRHGNHEASAEGGQSGGADQVGHDWTFAWRGWSEYRKLKIQRNPGCR